MDSVPDADAWPPSSNACIRKRKRSEMHVYDWVEPHNERRCVFFSPEKCVVCLIVQLIYTIGRRMRRKRRKEISRRKARGKFEGEEVHGKREFVFYACMWGSSVSECLLVPTRTH